MDLVGRGPNGRLDSLSACMLLWSGSVSFGEGAIAWDGGMHHAGAPTINGGVTSLYGVSKEEVAAVIPDLLCILESLERDEQLSVPQDCIEKAVREILPHGQLTGMTLFLLQSGSHPLVIDAADDTAIRIRYHECLARGIPDLQGLLCRLAQRLWLLGGMDGTFVVQFLQSDLSSGACGIQGFQGEVAGATPHLDAFVELEAIEETRPLSVATGTDERDGNDSPQVSAHARAATMLRRMSLLETDLFSIDALLRAEGERLKDLQGLRGQLESAKPSLRAKEYQAPSPSSLGIPTSRDSMRTMVRLTALYLVVGIALILCGRACVFEGDRLTQHITQLVDYVVNTAYDTVNLVTGREQLLGTHIALSLPTESWADGLRIAGMLLMTFGILFPILKVLRLRRRMSREEAFRQTHATPLMEMVEKSRQRAEVAYAVDLDAWASNLRVVEEDEKLVRKSIGELEGAKECTLQSLARCYAQSGIPEGMRELATVCTLADYVDAGVATSIDEACALYRADLATSRVSANPEQATELQPTLRSASRSAASLVRGIRAESSEKRRCERISAFCKEHARTTGA